MKGILKVVSAALLFAFAGAAWSVNVNTADAKTLAKELAGVGDALSNVIVEERKKAPFTGVEDLEKRIKGWGKKTSEKNKDKLKFSDK
jgi:competence protein ComEA